MKTSVKQIVGALATLGLGFAMVGCTPAEDAETTQEGVTSGAKDGKGDQIGGGSVDSDQQLVCVGIRGNGDRIFSHFGAMARIHEHYGMISGVAGGSSGSISTFLTESMYINPALYSCGGETCENSVSGQRAALMFKSIEGYVTELAQTDEVKAFQQLAPVFAQLKAQGVGEMVDAQQFEQARQAMLTVFESEELRSLINPEVIFLLKESTTPEFHVADIWKSVQGFGSFKVEAPDVLIRPGVLSFEAVADKMGRIGDFYAGYGPDRGAQWSTFLDQCAEQSKGKTWTETSALVAEGSGQTCGQLFSGLVTSWREEALANYDSFEHRLDEPVGKHLSALVTTSLIMGDAVPQWQDGRAAYAEGSFLEDLGINYASDVRLGYWGAQADLDNIESNPLGFDDMKTQMFFSLGEGTYRQALSLSPAEPGLARALEITEALVSTGGWSDLEPTLVLRNMGCEQIILVTRQGDTVGFGADVSRQLGMTQAQEDALFATGTDSSVKRSLEEADGVWCTDWDSHGGLDFAATSANGYNAPMEVHTSWLTDVESAYENTSERLGLQGCTPGVSE